MFINPAFAQAAAGAATAPTMSQTVFQLGVIAVVFYLLLIRPGQIRTKQHQAMRDALVKGDKIITAGGVYAKVVKVEAETLVVEIADNTKITIVKSSIQDVLDENGKSKLDANKPAAVQKNLSKEQPVASEKAKEIKEEVTKEEAPKAKKTPAPKAAAKTASKAKKTTSKAKKSDKLKEALSK